jgi:hypothetical protein
MQTIDIHTILEIAGALVPLFSAIGSFFNHLIRKQQEAGQELNKALVGANAVVNAVAFNVDKAVQMGQMFKAVSKPAEVEAPAEEEPTTVA